MDAHEIDGGTPPFDQFKTIQPLASKRSGRESFEHARHLLYAARDKQSRTNVLIKLASKPGLTYQHNLTNEIATLTTVNRELPDSRYFPVIREHGQLRDGRVYLITYLFDELPLATVIGDERIPARMVAHVRTAIEVAKALGELHGLAIFHVDLNPMNILYRSEKGSPIIRIVDFESSYETARHAAGVFYSPPTTPRYSAPEVSSHAPDARADVYSLGAVLYTLLTGFRWTWEGEVGACVAADLDLDAELRETLRIATDPDPGGRYPTIQEFRVAVTAYLERIWPGRTW